MQVTATRSQVVRFLLDAQGLTPHDRTDVLSEIRRLEYVQIDPVAAVERNQHLVLGARVPTYRPAQLDALLAERRILEYFAIAMCVMPLEDYPIFAGSRRRFRDRVARHLAPLGSVANEIRTFLATHGPQPARAFETDHRVHGWWDTTKPRTKATSHALSLMLYSGEITVVRREGNTRIFDLAQNAIPKDLFEAGEQISSQDADAAVFAKYCRALRIFDAGDPHFAWRRPNPTAQRRLLLKHPELVQVAIKDVARPYWMLAADVDALQATPRKAPAPTVAHFLPPLDNLLHHRRRLLDLFGFDYTWEVYVPAARRRYGYYTMPILVGDSLVGRMDPQLDRETGRLVVGLLHLEPHVPVTARLRTILTRSLQRFARWHGATEVRISRIKPATLFGKRTVSLEV